MIKTITAYEYLMARVRVSSADKGASSSSIPASIATGCVGAMSGGLSKLAVYPMDTVKKRLQRQAFYGPQGAATYKGALYCTLAIARDEGARALYRGLLPTVIKSMAGTGLTFAFFNATRNALVDISREEIAY